MSAPSIAHLLRDTVTHKAMGDFDTGYGAVWEFTFDPGDAIPCRFERNATSEVRDAMQEFGTVAGVFYFAPGTWEAESMDEGDILIHGLTSPVTYRIIGLLRDSSRTYDKVPVDTTDRATAP